jgi:hypothetical protein
MVDREFRDCGATTDQFVCSDNTHSNRHPNADDPDDSPNTNAQ